jgi:hypothetical protein
VASSTNNVAANGWSVPTSTQFNTLISYLGGASVAGGKVKEAGFAHWNAPNVGATNSSKFNAVASGNRSYNSDQFIYLGSDTLFWCKDKQITAQWGPALYADSTIFNQQTNHVSWGFSIRLIKDSTILTDGQSGTYIGNDGTVYNTICIGTQEWLAENLRETFFRNGVPIPLVKTGWAYLTSPARCTYNNR